MSKDSVVAYVRQGNNNYEWHVYVSGASKRSATLPTAEEANAWVKGYTEGFRHGTFAQ